MDEWQGAVGVGLPTTGIGVCADGLEFLEQFSRACPPNGGTAFVRVPHLDRGRESLLTAILQRSTAVLVVQARDPIRVERDHVCAIPPRREMASAEGFPATHATQAHDRPTS